MNKWFLAGIAIVALLVGGFFALNSYIYEEKQAYAASDYKDAEYVIEGERIRLEDGRAETNVPDSSAKAITKYFGNEVRLDMNEDAREDVAFILTHNAGGSGTFFYVVAALNTERGYVGSEAFLIGDRVAPQTLEKSSNPVHKGVIVINYADRKPSDPMTAAPSVGKSTYLKLDPQTMQFGTVETGFEGEADPSRMELMMKTWEWVSALYNDGKEVVPTKSGVFKLTFGSDGRFSATTDCNSLSGSYSAADGSISFGSIAMTKMFCAGSQEMEFVRLLENADSYRFTSKGELIFDLKLDSGNARFK